MPEGHFLGMLYHHHQGNSSEQNLIHGFLVTHICKTKTRHYFPADFGRNTCREHQTKINMQNFYASDHIPLLSQVQKVTRLTQGLTCFLVPSSYSKLPALNSFKAGP